MGPFLPNVNRKVIADEMHALSGILSRRFVTEPGRTVERSNDPGAEFVGRVWELRRWLCHVPPQA